MGEFKTLAAHGRRPGGLTPRAGVDPVDECVGEAMTTESQGAIVGV